jgi:hypothetical protein
MNHEREQIGLGTWLGFGHCRIAARGHGFDRRHVRRGLRFWASLAEIVGLLSRRWRLAA